MRVHWTNTARRHLQAIHDYIAQDSPRYAKGMVDRLTRRAEELGRYSGLGAIVPEYQADDVREVLEFPYRIMFRVMSEQIDILAVIHGARLLPPSLAE